ncbi:MAG: hypothetical protein K1X64_00095 [Myxococcaceae bacterium]|nr:hypothetical protein [Myxococcaceae bacterium]
MIINTSLQVRPHWAGVTLACLVAGASSCGERSEVPPPFRVVAEDAFDLPLVGVTSQQRTLFNEGDRLFGLPFRPVDGLGPLYIRTACGACHEEAGKGPGRVTKMAVVESDGLTPSADQSALPWGHTQRPYFVAGATQPIAAPTGVSLKLSNRIGPAVLGRGYIEAVADEEIVRVEAEQASRTDGIRGRINRVEHHSEANPDQPFHTLKKGDRNVMGRFGLKARSATLDDFTADAFMGDMGLTSLLRPVEPLNPDGLTDDERPGVDLPLLTVNQVADYMRLIEIPARVPNATGSALFARTGCDGCHVPSLRTRADYPIAQLAGIDAFIYSDLLLHDLGEGLADGVVDEQAGSRDWRTAPLIGVRFMRNYLHDGRATSVEEAVLAHGGEAQMSVQHFKALSDSDRDVLLQFVQSL